MENKIIELKDLTHIRNELREKGKAKRNGK